MASVDEITKAYEAQQKTSATTPGATAPQTAATGATTTPDTTTGSPTTPTTPTTPATPAASADGATSGASNNVMNGAYTTARTDAINQMYEAQRKAREEELKAAYDRSMSDYQAARDKIAPEYQKQANDLSVQYERNRQNFNNQAAATGINSGTASQAALARNGEYQRDFGNLRTAEANATAEADRKMANLTAEYQTNIRAALADNDYKKAAALLDEYNNGYQRDLKNAQILAEFGDFSAFANLYGADQAKNMEAVWRAQNPELAASLDYAAGKIDAEQYRQLTGEYPAGYIPAGGFGGGGGGGNIDYSGWVGQGEGNYMQADGSYGPTPSWEQPSGPTISSGAAIRAAASSGNPSAALGSMVANGNISPSTASNLEYALKNPGR